MPTAIIAYPHDPRTFEPVRLAARQVWRVAVDARDRLCRHADHPRVDVAEIAVRSRSLVVNGVPFETHWDCGAVVQDGEGRAAFGSIQHDAGSDTAFIALNPHLIGERDELWRSTAAHELGHAIFDVPEWIIAAAAQAQPTLPKRVLLRREEKRQPKGPILDWSEWRASEFMGAFLVPRRLLAAHVLKKAVELGLPLTLRNSNGMPLLDADASGHDGVEAIVLELAELFGLSPAFIHLRLRKYRLLYSR